MINIHSASLTPPPVIFNLGQNYSAARRLWQGIPGIECTTGGRLYATWYSGGEIEGPENHVLLVRSDDHGTTWSEPLLAIDPPGQVRAFDPVLWIDPQKRLWLFWAQCFSPLAPKWSCWNGVGGVWFIRCDDPDADSLAWTAPERIANGILMNKPIVHTNGEWLLPVCAWSNREPKIPELKDEALSNVVVSTDNGLTFFRRGTGAEVPGAIIDEPMVVERKDRSLWMLIRTQYGIGQSHSNDGGATWTRGTATGIAGPDSRFHIRRLPSGRLLLINHHGFSGRSHLTASLSEDDGLSWCAHLLLDERPNVSYPDATLTAEGQILVIYDRERHDDKEILLAGFTEADIQAGTVHSSGGFLKRIVNRP